MRAVRDIGGRPRKGKELILECQVCCIVLNISVELDLFDLVFFKLGIVHWNIQHSMDERVLLFC